MSETAIICLKYCIEYLRKKQAAKLVEWEIVIHQMSLDRPLILPMPLFFWSVFQKAVIIDCAKMVEIYYQ